MLDVPLWMWLATIGGIVALLLADLLVFHREAHEIALREAVVSSLAWVGLGVAFGVGVLVLGGATAGGEYFAGYLIEKALSVENVFVFALVLGAFAVPAELQHRVLFYGVVGALVLRGVFIAGGQALLDRFGFLLYVFGAFLVWSGIKMARHTEIRIEPHRNPVLRLVRRLMPTVDEYHGQRFTVKVRTERGRLRRAATPMLAVLIAIETTDVVFAIDSIPAIFAVTDDPFIVFTSNAFAILGLRALYFVLAGFMDRLSYLKLGLAAVLVFVGVKMFVSNWYHLPIAVSLVVIATILTVAVVASLRRAPGGLDHTGAAAQEPAEAEVCG
jgi:tellurite resistance protein TerC